MYDYEEILENIEYSKKTESTFSRWFWLSIKIGFVILVFVTIAQSVEHP